ncbi:MAG: class I fructose-bisphosphate aldolase [Limisphaerales bacterium]
MNAHAMESTVEALVASGKGILAADESFSTIEKRFKDFQIPSTEENRRDYRQMLFTTPKLNEFISGVILFDETIRQKSADGVSLSQILSKQNIIPGIKVDKGTASLPNFAGEKFTQGLDGLRERLAEYRELGARFTKWRAVIKIGDSIPTRACIEANARALAIFAALSQEAGLAPIVEPEVLMDGNHTIARCEEVTSTTLKIVFGALFEHRVALEQMLLKPSMVLSGKECPQQAGDSEVADTTLRCFRRTVPAAVPGIVFLSGGQSDEDATRRLNAICRENNVPWKLSFSFGRALQSPALKIWKGISRNVPAAQKALHHRARCNGFATQGKYSVSMENTN